MRKRYGGRQRAGQCAVYSEGRDDEEIFGEIAQLVRLVHPLCITAIEE